MSSTESEWKQQQTARLVQHRKDLKSAYNDLEFMHVTREVVEEIVYHLDRYDSATSRSVAAHHYTALQNEVSNLKSWHPSHDYETGEIVGMYED